MIPAVIFIGIMYLVIGVASLGSRDRTQHDFENYHQDPYYYYPRNEPPAYFGGNPQYPVNPYFIPPPPQIIYASRRPQPGGSLFSRLTLLMLLAFMLFAIAIKLNLLNIYVSIGHPGYENNYEWQRNPIPAIDNTRNSEYGQIRSAKDSK